MFLTASGRIYEFKFGLKGLMLYHENLNLIAEQNFLSFLLYCGLISEQPNITIDEINDIASQCDLSSIVPPKDSSSLYIQGLYTKAVGEIGIAPDVCYRMTPEEIELAYEGYLRRQETTANLTKIAILEALNNNVDLIRLTEDKGYVIGTEEERQAVFKKLNIL